MIRKEKEFAVPSASEYYDIILHRFNAFFRPLVKVKDAKDAEKFPEFSLSISKKMTFDELAKAVANRIHLSDSYRLRFHYSTSISEAHKLPLRRIPDQILNVSLGHTFSTLHNAHILFWYEVAEVSYLDLESKRLVKVGWVDHSGRETVMILFIIGCLGFIGSEKCTGFRFN